MGFDLEYTVCSDVRRSVFHPQKQQRCRDIEMDEDEWSVMK